MARYHTLCDAIATKLNATAFGTVQDPITVTASRAKLLREEFEAIQTEPEGTAKLFVVPYAIPEAQIRDRAYIRETIGVAIVLLVRLTGKAVADSDPWDDLAEQVRDWVAHFDQLYFADRSFGRLEAPTEPELAEEELLDIDGVYATQILCSYRTEYRNV